MLLAFEVDGRYLFGGEVSCSNDALSVGFLLVVAHVEGLLTAKVAVVACYGLSLVAGLGKLPL